MFAKRAHISEACLPPRGRLSALIAPEVVGPVRISELPNAERWCDRNRDPQVRGVRSSASGRCAPVWSERRRFYLRWGRRSSCNFVFVRFSPIGFVRGTWLRLRKVSNPALRDPFPTRGRKAGGFRDSRRSTARCRSRCRRSRSRLFLRTCGRGGGCSSELPRHGLSQ